MVRKCLPCLWIPFGISRTLDTALYVWVDASWLSVILVALARTFRWRTSPFLREHHHTLLDSCMLFLTMERPLDEINGFGGNSSSWINCMPLRFQQPFNSGITHRYTSHATHRFLHRQVGLHRLNYSCLQPLGKREAPACTKLKGIEKRLL